MTWQFKKKKKTIKIYNFAFKSVFEIHEDLNISVKVRIFINFAPMLLGEYKISFSKRYAIKDKMRLKIK